jgi:hypothetical protein
VQFSCARRCFIEDLMSPETHHWICIAGSRLSSYALSGLVELSVAIVFERVLSTLLDAVFTESTIDSNNSRVTAHLVGLKVILRDSFVYPNHSAFFRWSVFVQFYLPR